MEKLIIMLCGAVLIALLPAVNVHADGFLVMGDSQSFVVCDEDCNGDASKNWPHLLQQYTGRHFFNLSRGGRRISDGHVAEYLRLADVHALNQQAQGLIVAPGSLDALFKTDYMPALQDAIQEAESRDMDVYCVLPPNNKVMDNAPIRADIRSVCPIPIDLSQWVGPGCMADAVHFNEECHIYTAGVVFVELLKRGALVPPAAE